MNWKMLEGAVCISLSFIMIFQILYIPFCAVLYTLLLQSEIFTLTFVEFVIVCAVFLFFIFIRQVRLEYGIAKEGKESDSDCRHNRFKHKRKKPHPPTKKRYTAYGVESMARPKIKGILVRDFLMGHVGDDKKPHKNQ